MRAINISKRKRVLDSHCIGADLWIPKPFIFNDPKLISIVPQQSYVQTLVLLQTSIFNGAYRPNIRLSCDLRLSYMSFIQRELDTKSTCFSPGEFTRTVDFAQEWK